jgi:N,N-dimethylformamidase beta subunit-like, C-terminal/Domain of unknown function (DUF4082)/Bacterial Ig-like domain (group 2)/Bacterial Ig domain
MRRNIVMSFGLLLLASGMSYASCTAPQNAIEAENCNPGTNEFDVSGSGDPTIQGFATDISVNVGQTINFKINTTASSYHIDIYRIGYYAGTGGRLITTIQPSAKLPQAQPACLTDSTTQLYDCGNWGVSASWTVPATAVSGVYVAAPVRTDTGGASQILFIVRNDSSHSDMLFQTSDESWQAYNDYGGHSVYGPTDAFNLTNRAYKVSYNRPFNTRAFQDESVTYFFGTEYPMIRWLEANGYDVTYFTGIDAARSGSLVKNHKIYLSVGHDEYWSGPQRTNVEAARDAGVNMAFLSGNEVFWKTRWENSIDGSSTPFRTMVVYKETLGPNSTPQATAAVDPLDPPTWTGTWRDKTKSPPADGGRPENALTGTIFMVNGPGTDNPGSLSIKVPAADGKMRFWRNTTVANLGAGTTATLPAATLGYEWDEDLDNGARPAGTFDLSTASVNLTSDLLLDQGGTYGAGTAVHHMTMYRAASGALVFGAGTVQWSWGLDSTHDNPFSFGSPAPSADMRQAMVNLFADMGAQPVTLQSGLLAASQSIDSIAPTSQVSSPANGSQVRIGTNVTITGTAADIGGGVVGGVEVSVDGGTTWHPAVGRENWTYAWTPSTSGNYTIRTRATDDSANLEAPSPGITVAATTTAQTLTSLTLNAANVTGGNPVPGTVTLGQPAASGGVVVTLSSNNPAVASVPSSVTVPAGQFTANFTVTTSAVNLLTTVTISGTFVATTNATLTVRAVLPPPAGSVAIDALISTDTPSSSTTVTSGALSTTVGNELILAMIATDASAANITVTNVTGAGLTWALVKRTNTQMGTSEIWRAFSPTPISNASVTATLSQSVVSSLLVVSVAGVDMTGTGGSGAIGNTGTGNGGSGAPTASLTTTRNNSIVLGVGNDWDSPVARVPGTNQILLHQSLASSGDTYWMQMQNAPIGLSGTVVTINDTAPTTDRYNLSIAEVRPAVAGSTFNIAGNIAPQAAGSGALVTLGGAAPATVTADASGNYSFQNLLNGLYTVTPSKAGVVFTPSTQSVTVNGANMTANFAGAILQAISVTPSNATIQAGGTQSFVATGTYSDGSNQNVTSRVAWSSSNTNVASINASGTASGIAGGSSTITASQTVNGVIISGNGSLTVQATPLVITTTSLPSGLQNQAYSASLAATGGTAPYAWSLANGTVLPAGLGLSSGGLITGIATVAGTGSFTVQVTDGASPAQTATQPLSIVITSPPAFNTIWTPVSAPTTTDVGPDSPVELGVLFKSDVNGNISGLRFYKSTANTGTHVGNLWSSTGTLLGTATFINETASGWQQVSFGTPVAITANTVYVASYHTTVGHYADDQNYFATVGVDSPPLHALQNGVSGADGVFAYGTNSVFPNGGFNSSNYWVDVVFAPAAVLTSIALTPANPTIQAGGTQAFIATGTYRDSTTQNITSQVTWSSSNTAAATVNAAGVATGIAGGTSSIKATLGAINNSTTLTVQPATLLITTASLPSGSQGGAYTAGLASSGGTPAVSWKLINNTTLPSGLVLSTAGQITGTPTASGTTTFTVQATDSGVPVQTATQILSITIAAAGCPCGISGTISGSGGNGATVTLSGGATVTANTSGGYTFTGVANGSYTVTPTKTGFTFTPANQPVTVNNANVTGVNFTSTQNAGTGLAIDAKVFKDGTKATTIASPAFSTTAANELVLAFVTTDYLSGTNTTVTGVTGGGLTWTLVVRTNAQSGGSEVWRAFAPSPLSNASATATLSQSVVASITVMSFTGVDTTGVNGAGAIGATASGNGNTGAPNATLITTRNNSWVFGVGNDFDNAIARTPGAGQSLVHQDLTSTGDTYWVQMQNAPTTLSGTSVSINDTAPTTDRYNLSAVEVRTP